MDDVSLCEDARLPWHLGEQDAVWPCWPCALRERFKEHGKGKHSDLQSLGTARLDGLLICCAGHCCSFRTPAKLDPSLQGHAPIVACPPRHQLLNCPSTSGRHVHKRSDPHC